MAQLDENKNTGKVHKKRLKGMFPLVFCCLFIVILAATVIPILSSNHSKKTDDSSLSQTEDKSSKRNKNVPILAVLKSINEKDKTIELLDVKSEEDTLLNYTGGTEIYDKYNQALALSQLTVGEMVDAYYSTGDSKLSKIQISDQAWEYKNVSNWDIDTVNKIFTIAEKDYQYTNSLVLSGRTGTKQLTDLNEKDELLVKGYKSTVCSIIITKGHGTVQFEDYDDFIGGTAYIGNDEILPVKKNMKVTVQEGTYEVVLENGNLMGSKKITVGAEEEITVDMGKFKKEAVKKGLVSFDINPKGADLYIDNNKQDYNKAIELEYGEHEIKVILGGYTAYKGYIAVEEASQSLSISLAEAQSEDNDNNKPAGTVKTNTKPKIPAVNNTDKKNDNTTDNTADDNTTDETAEDTGSETEKKEAGNYIDILEPEGASVYFEGSNYKGEVPVSFPKEIGTYHITLIKSGYITQTYTVEFKDDGKDAVLKYDLEKLK